MRLSVAAFLTLSCVALAACLEPPAAPHDPGTSGPADSGRRSAEPHTSAVVASVDLGRYDVMESKFCAQCHPAIYAEHERSTHGRAFTDQEVRLATGRFAHKDCIICHTPRPIFETGIGQNPKRRHFGLVEGITCMTCHWSPEHDYSGFSGGSECSQAFHADVGTVEACASCHRNHGTPYQWAASPTGKASGRVCMDCHMAEVERPVAVGGPPREVRSHGFPGSRSESQVRRAYAYEAAIEGDTAVIKVRNQGAGHNFPTELKQRSVESLVIVRDLEGVEIARSRMVFRDPYKRPYGLELPVNTQIPGGQERVHRVPIGVAAGTVETELFFKLYFPIGDYHPDLSRVLESRRLPFSGITPSSEPVVGDPEVTVKTPENIRPEMAGLANLVDYVHPEIGTVAVDIPEGSSPDDIRQLIDLFQFPVPQANGAARKRLAEIGLPAVPALIDALGSWDNKTYNQSKHVLEAIGRPARPAIVAALDDERLFVRLHARDLVREQLLREEGVEAALERGLSSQQALDRASAMEALGTLGYRARTDEMRALLSDADPDVVRAAALALARLGVKAAAPEIEAARGRARFDETRRDLAYAAARLGSPAGVLTLLEGLDNGDDLVRERFFELFFALTGKHLGYDPLAPHPERLDAIASLQAWWAAEGGPQSLRPFRADADPLAEAHAWKLVAELGGNGKADSTLERDQDIEEELVGMGAYGVPSLVRGLKYPPGFAEKRAALCRILGRIGDPRSAPVLMATLRDPVLSVAAWAAWALEGLADPATRPALVRYEQRLRTLIAQRAVPAAAGSPDLLLAQVARSRLALGDEAAVHTLAALLLSEDESTRRFAFEALQRTYGEDRGYDPGASVEARRAAAPRWMD